MKKITVLLSLLVVVVLAACNNESSESSTEAGETSTEQSGSENLFNPSTVEEGTWISQNGEIVEREGMVVSEAIEYNPEEEYSMNNSAYVTYFSGDEILKTLLLDEGRPITLDTVDEADSIKVSIDEGKVENFELTVQ